ncbi:hypothetical protein P7C73_g6030, partial [Tremellales sp. Uapishka_1]
MVGDPVKYEQVSPSQDADKGEVCEGVEMRIPKYMSFIILITSWLAFILIITIHEIYIKRHETWRFVEQLIIYNTLFFLALTSLIAASNRSPGHPDPSLAPASSRPTISPSIADRSSVDIPLRFLRNSQWAKNRDSKDRPSPLPLSNTAAGPSSPIAMSVNPFHPSTPVDAGLDEIELRDDDQIGLPSSDTSDAGHPLPFILFVTYGTILAVYTTAEAGYEAYRYLSEPQPGAYDALANAAGADCPDDQACPTQLTLLSAPVTTDVGPVIIMMLTLMGFFFSLSVGSLMSYHWYLVLNNQTTLESLSHTPPAALVSAASSKGWKPDHLLTRGERNRLRDEAHEINVYDLGWRKNLREVFGDGAERQMSWVGVVKALWPSNSGINRRANEGHWFPYDEEAFEMLKVLTMELRLGSADADHGSVNESSEEEYGEESVVEGDEEDADDWEEKEDAGPTVRGEGWFEA